MRTSVPFSGIFREPQGTALFVFQPLECPFLIFNDVTLPSGVSSWSQRNTTDCSRAKSHLEAASGRMKSRDSNEYESLSLLVIPKKIKFLILSEKVNVSKF